jgi:hypothetical protein
MTFARDIPAPINGARAIMSDRKHPRRSRDMFPTPPWATRALMERVFPHLGYTPSQIQNLTAWEPACGKGHMSEVLEEYFGSVYASDRYEYGYGKKVNFLDSFVTPADDWIITNPPFGDVALAFVQLALAQARVGVAMFFRTQWAVEGIERYETLFRDRPPTVFAPFVERVNLCKGKWKPNGTTATAYCWLVWVHGRKQLPPFFIPPGCRKQLTKPDDSYRFANR